MEEKFLTKNTKITIKEEAAPPGLKQAEKVHDEDGKINKDALKAIATKLEDYYGDELKELDPVPKVTAQDAVGSDGVDVFNIEALGSGKMSALEYEAEGSEIEKKFQKRVDDLNDTSEYDKNFGTKDGFGETDEPDETYDKLKKAAAEYNKYEDEYELPNPLRVKQAKEIKSESKENKNKKMKRLNFKNPFGSVDKMKSLIPENYKTEGNIFLMTDGNETYKVRWDSTLNEGTVINYKNKERINEDMDKMKKLFNYQYSDSKGNTNDYVTEKEAFTTIMESISKTGELILEQDDDVPNGVSGTVLPTFEIISKKTEPVKTLSIAYNGQNPKTAIQAYDYEYLVYPNVRWDSSVPGKKELKEIPNSYMIYLNKDGKTLPVASVGNGRVNQIFKGGSQITDLSPTLGLVGLLNQLNVGKNNAKILVQSLPTVKQMSFDNWYEASKPYATPAKSGKYLTVTTS